jgi:nucleoid-associated protein YgaU
VGNLARAGVFCLMGLAICLARLVEVELGQGPGATISAKPVAGPAEPAPIQTAVPVETPAPAPVAVQQPEALRVRSYVIKAGDTLGSISKTVYGTSKAWKKIYTANRRLLPAPDRLKVGKTLVIPPH